MYILQYFVFDETGNDILQANGIPFEDLGDLQDCEAKMINEFCEDDAYNGSGLVLRNIFGVLSLRKDKDGVVYHKQNNGKEVLYNSKED